MITAEEAYEEAEKLLRGVDLWSATVEKAAALARVWIALAESLDGRVKASQDITVTITGHEMVE